MATTRERLEDCDVADGHLIRSVLPARGAPYEHRCPRESLEEIAHAAEGLADAGFTLEELAATADRPSTQAAVALAFLKERGCIVTRYRRNYPASGCLFEDAMTEYWALAEKGDQ